MKKKILVTGSAGFVGSHVVEHLLANTDWDIVGLDSFRHRGDSLRIQGDMDPSRYTVHCTDLTAPISTRLAAKIGHVDFIVNLASESHVDRSITDPVPFVENNVKLALNMLEYARTLKGLKTFIQFSTDEVFGPALPGTFHKESHPIYVSNPYSASKAAQDAIAMSYWRTYGVPLIITHSMNLYAQRQDSEKYIPMLIKKIYAGEEVTVHGTPGRIGSRIYIHCRNASDAILFILTKTEPTRYEDVPDRIIAPDRYNIVGPDEVDNLTLAQTVARIMGKPLKYRLENFHKNRPGHDFRYALDGSKLAKMGWKPPKTFEESLKETIDWTLKHPEWLE